MDSDMMPEIGNLLLYLLLIQSVAFATWFAGSRIFSIGNAVNSLKKQMRQMLAAWSLILCCSLMAMLVLIYCYVHSDFSVLNVYNNSSTHKPLIFKIVGAWGNHEGSMLLWLIAVSAISWVSAVFYSRRKLSDAAQHLVLLMLTIQLLVLGVFIVYVIFASNPFIRLFPVPLEGLGLNPLLQDIGLAMHPPSLYLGYVGFSLVYSGIIAALIRKEVNEICAIILLPWVIFSWTILTIGIALGSWWAYRELGWGGFWFWDPVENISLLPWFSATILFHSLLVLQKAAKLKHWVVLFSIATFALSIVGTLVVRSGIITSVHSFALDPERGNFIIAILVILTFAALIIYMWRWQYLQVNYRLALLSREFFILMNNMLLLIAIAIVMIATFYPLLLQNLTGQQITVGAPYFNATLIPLTLGTLILAALGSICAWQQDVLTRLLKHYKRSALASVGLTAMLIVAAFPDVKIWPVLFIFLGSWLLCTMVMFFWRSNSNKAMLFAHSGFAILVIALAFHFMGKIEINRSVRLDERVAINGYDLKAINIIDAVKDNYYARKVAFMLYYKGRDIGMLMPENRLFPLEKQLTRESAILQTIWADIYVTIGDVHAAGKDDPDQTPIITLHATYNPAIAWIWFGCLLMAIGGSLGFARHLFTGRFRELY